MLLTGNDQCTRTWIILSIFQEKLVRLIENYLIRIEE